MASSPMWTEVEPRGPTYRDGAVVGFLARIFAKIDTVTKRHDFQSEERWLYSEKLRVRKFHKANTLEINKR